MARGVVARGDIWLYEFAAPDKRRPVLVLSRPAVIELLDTVMVAPITRTIHGVPSEVVVGVEQGLKTVSAANLDNVQTVRQAKLAHWVGNVGEAMMADVCVALAAATGCG